MIHVLLLFVDITRSLMFCCCFTAGSIVKHVKRMMRACTGSRLFVCLSLYAATNTATARRLTRCRVFIPGYCMSITYIDMDLAILAELAANVLCAIGLPL